VRAFPVSENTPRMCLHALCKKHLNIEATMETTREHSLNKIGQSYIDMKNGKARGFSVTIYDEGDSAARVAFSAFDMTPLEVIRAMMGMIEQIGEELEGEDDEN
jgi:hypothetical protein